MIENLQTVIFEVLHFIRTELRARIARFIERARQAFKLRTEGSFSARQQTRAAERWLAEHHAAFEAALYNRMLEAFNRTANPKDIAYDQLQLLDDESLNVVMLRAHLVSSLMERAREDIVALEVRLEAMKVDGFDIDTRAFTPGAIADGFVETLNALSVPIEAQVLLMEAYGQHGVEMLAQFYHDFNELLIKHGVMPGFKYSVGKSAAKPKPAQPAFAPGGGAPGTGTGAPSGSGPGGSGAGPGGGGGSGAAGTADAIPAWPAVGAGGALPAQFVQLVDAKLTAMQEALSHLTGETWQPGALRDAFRLPPPISLSPEQEESIDHIEAVFLDLIRDTRISPRFRSELNRLILPLMSLRLSDAELFKDPDNPVRRFIRQLALLGFRDNELPIQEFEHIGLIVGRIVSERGQEVSSFLSGADALYTIARNEVRIQLEQRSKPKPAAPPKQDASAEHAGGQHALEFVRTVLRELSADLHLPSVVQHFVLRLLAPLLIARCRQYGVESPQVREAVAETELFFRLLEPSLTGEDHEGKVHLRQRVLEQLAFRAFRARMKEDETRMLLEGVADFFDTLNADPHAGLFRGAGADDASFVSYLDDLTVARSD